MTCPILMQAKILARGSYQEITASGIVFDQLCRFPNETKIEGDIDKETNSSDHDVSRECVKSSVDEIDLNKDKTQPIEVSETRSSGHISKKVYTSYVSAFGSSLIICCFFFMNFMTPVLTTSVDFWITFWYNVVTTRYARVILTILQN